MNLRQYSIALLISALPITAMANSQGIRLGPNDFVTIDKLLENGESSVSFKLSKSGRSKVKKLKTPIPGHAEGMDLNSLAAHSGIENGR